jgi:FtsP/CotA-like multicopper oxidase with cupredoxin domain
LRAVKYEGWYSVIEFLTDNSVNWFHHCHNLYPMMAGMAKVVIYES